METQGRLTRVTVETRPTDHIEEAGREETQSKARTVDVSQPNQKVREPNPAAYTGLWIIQVRIKFFHLFFLQASAQVEGTESLPMDPMEGVRNEKVRNRNIWKVKLFQCFCFFS